ncbi:hypothetical protein OSB04_020504 [Centaurea solstitialis]|uniref:Integrase catalytic domain-containing protein n=1 Tax=Centaurea solstitialis TaxID=347529 RepID=A0AA38T3S4_9ASTR|nr:hypothetical protein OSB04_020504 [Centaurea solstitialis]
MSTPNNQVNSISTNAPNQLLTINTLVQAPLKLTPSNYLSWKVQFQTLLTGYDLLGYIDGSKPCPSSTVTTNNEAVPNPAYSLWVRQDQLILNALISSLSPSLISFVARAKTSHEAWTSLANTYAKPTRGRIKQVKSLLKNPTQGTMTITEFLHSIKARADELAILGSPMDEEDLTEKILDGLNHDYKELVRAVQARDTCISFDELHEKLLSFGASLSTNSKSAIPLPITVNPTHTSNSNGRPYKNFNYRPNTPSPARNTPSPTGNTNWRPSHNNFNRPPPRTNRPPPRPYQGFCQICGIQGHTAKRCSSFQLVPMPSSATNNNPPRAWQPQAHYAANMVTDTSPWLLDSGASHHVTTDLNNLSLHAPYVGSDDVMIGDGTGLSISHTGSASLSTPTTKFSLNDVLCVPSMKKNLISVSKFCITNNTSVEFLPFSYLVKDLRTGTTLLTGNAKDGVYEWPPTQPKSSPILAFSQVKTTSTNWHHRLGHPAYSILNHMISYFQLEFSSPLSKEFSCNACLSNKSHKLSFSVSSLTSTKPLEIIFSDVWTSPVVSQDGFKYYVIFVDHFTKYIWFYPLQRKSDVHEVFKRFKVLVENYFQHKIISFYSDNGGEYMGLKDYLSRHGISHLTTPPHTPEHNGYSERRHRHIVETGLALLSHASIPTTFWPHAFATAVYLINRLPTPTLNMFSPYKLIFQKNPNYSKLKVFGCLCFPWLRPYSSHKLTPRSQPCIFLGYSLSQSAYICFEPSARKFFVSRHVQFVESVFPYVSLHTTLSRPTSTTIDTWIPPVLNISSPPSSAQPSHTPSAASSQEVPSVEAPSHSNSPSRQPTSPTRQPPTVSAIPIPPSGQHRMTTRAKNNITKPIQKLNLHAHKTISQPMEPTSLSQALKDERWCQAMCEEYDALVKNATWELVPTDGIANLVDSKWVYRIKRHSDGSIDRYKARLVAKGFQQRPGMDYQETFSPVVKPTTVRLVLSIAVHYGWSLRQLDVNNAFLQGKLSETVFMNQPPGFVNSDYPSYVCKLHKAIYGLKQAPRAWYHELRQFLIAYGFKNSYSDTSLFVLKHNNHVLYLLVYVDDIIVTGSSDDLVSQFVGKLADRFSLKDLGSLSYFLGVEVLPHHLGIQLSQKRYIEDLLKRLIWKYRAVVGKLQYLSLTRPDISFAVNKMAQFMHMPTDEHWVLVKRILRYLCGTLNKGLLLYRDSPLALHAFSDADWAGNKDNYASTGAYLVYLGRNLVSWSSKKQSTIARSSTEAEYRSVAATASELRWVSSLLSELGVGSLTTPVVYCDNNGATKLSSNPVFHSRMKHVAVDYHFIRDQVQSGLLRVSQVSSADQLADLLTKPLPTSQGYVKLFVCDFFTQMSAYSLSLEILVLWVNHLSIPSPSRIIATAIENHHPEPPPSPPRTAAAQNL